MKAKMMGTAMVMVASTLAVPAAAHQRIEIPVVGYGSEKLEIRNAKAWQHHEVIVVQGWIARHGGLAPIRGLLRIEVRNANGCVAVRHSRWALLKYQQRTSFSTRFPNQHGSEIFVKHVGRKDPDTCSLGR